MNSSEIDQEVRQYAAERDLVLWEDFPWGGATVLWPEGAEFAAFLEVMERLEAPVLYMEGPGDIVGFAANGVIHAFPSPEMRQRLVGEPGPAEIEFEVDDESSVSVPDYRNPYYDYQSGRTVEGELRELVDRIVADERFDGYRSRRLVAEYVAQLDAQDADTVENVAARVFNETVGKELDNRVTRLLPGLASDPEFDPLAWGGDLEDFLAARLPDEDPRVLERLGRELPGYARESGLASKAEREVTETARQVLGSLPPLVRDQLGFTSKNATRLQLIGSYLGDIPENRKQHVLRKLVDLESDVHAATREARYATATRRLMELGISKAEISRRLGISTSVMDRIVRANRSDIELDLQDPIVIMLAPEIG
jgi:hypothetical protein